MPNETPTIAEMQTAWVTALRTGRNAETGVVYAQVQGALHTPDGFCCLGVACDIAEPFTDCQWEQGEEDSADGYSSEHFTFCEIALELPREVIEILGVPRADPHVKLTYKNFQGDETPWTLAGLNDKSEGGKFDFNAIADAIKGADWYVGDPEA